jgi:P27 family predicted phage terminase small subunit
VTRGRKPKPVEQKIREGNPGHRPLPEPLKLDSGPPVKPDHLPPAAGELWDEVVTVLVAAGIADKVDKAALTALCVQWARSEMARVVIASEGYFAKGSMGQLVEHPAVKLEREAHMALLRFASEYGLTAASRARIAVAGGGNAAEAENELAAVIDLTPRLK